MDCTAIDIGKHLKHNRRTFRRPPNTIGIDFSESFYRNKKIFA